MNHLNLFHLNIRIFILITPSLWIPQLPKLPSKHFLNFHSDISPAITAESLPLHTASTKQTFACFYVQI